MVVIHYQKCQERWWPCWMQNQMHWPQRVRMRSLPLQLTESDVMNSSASPISLPLLLFQPSSLSCGRLLSVVLSVPLFDGLCCGVEPRPSSFTSIVRTVRVPFPASFELTVKKGPPSLLKNHETAIEFLHSRLPCGWRWGPADHFTTAELLLPLYEVRTTHF